MRDFAKFQSKFSQILERLGMIFTRNISEPMGARMSLNLKRTIIEDLSKFRSRLSHPGITTPISAVEKEQLEQVLKILDKAVQEIGNVA